MIKLDEATRSQLIKMSKDATRGRFKRRMSVDDERVRLKRIGMLELTARSPHLDIYFDINSYRSSIRIRNFIPTVQTLYRAGNYDLNVYRDVRRLSEKAFDLALNRNDIEVDCTCSDFRYRFAYVATIKNFKLGKPENRPARKTNPENKGSTCKHLTRVLNIPSVWKGGVITAITRSIRWDPAIVTGL